MKNENKKNSLASLALSLDPRVRQAKELLLAAVKEHQEQITGPRPPLSDLKISYENLLNSFAEIRGSKLWFPYLGSGIGNGCLVELLDGSVKYDFICGIGPHYLGHSNLGIISTGIDAALSDTIMQGHLQQNKDSVEFAELLVKSSKMDHCFLTTSGAMANENGLKIAFQKKYPAKRILAFEHCFEGRTLAMSQITDKPTYREGLPSNILIDYIPFFERTEPEKSIKESIDALKKLLQRYPKEYAVMCMELVQGEAGFYPGSRDFFIAILEILKENNVAVLFDEVQTFGRTPELFAYHYFELQEYANIVCVGKLSQTCATLFSKEFAPRPGLLSQTFTGSTSALRGGKFIIEHLLKEDYYGPNGKIIKIHQHFVRNLEKIAERNPNLLHGPYGIGTMIAFTPFDGEAKRTTQFVYDLFDAGVMSFIAGINPTRVRMLVPAGAITSEEIDNVCKIIESVLKSK
jgi:acetylornithine/N-succinyldiaminopimelate aminotransferase